MKGPSIREKFAKKPTKSEPIRYTHVFSYTLVKGDEVQAVECTIEDTFTAQEAALQAYMTIKKDTYEKYMFIFSHIVYRN